MVAKKKVSEPETKADEQNESESSVTDEYTALQTELENERQAKAELIAGK